MENQTEKHMEHDMGTWGHLRGVLGVTYCVYIYIYCGTYVIMYINIDVHIHICISTHVYIYMGGFLQPAVVRDSELRPYVVSAYPAPGLP